MLKQALIYTAFLGCAFLGSIGASAGDFGTNEEAKAMLDRAIIEMKADKNTAIMKFNHNDSQFRDRDLFVFCFNRKDGKFTAHEAMIGWDVRILGDVWGSPFGEEMFASPKNEQVTQVTYLSPMPGTIGFTTKRAYVATVGDQACGVSAYQLNGQVAGTQ